MHISWLGNSAIKIQTKPFDKDVTIVIDAYKQAKGNSPRSLTPDIALFTHGEEEIITLSGEPFIFSTPGEIDVKGVLITAVEGHNPGEIMLRIDAESMTLVHVGMVSKQLNAKQVEILAGADILCLPVGHPNSFDAESAVKMVTELEPRVVIPYAFHSDNDPDAKAIDGFLKEIGSKGVQPETKVILKEKDLPQEEMQVVVLEKE
ncbi:MAG: MBL fold metallo-hydrolase [Candidatus Magasanikbacteria bacterium]